MQGGVGGVGGCVCVGGGGHWGPNCNEPALGGPSLQKVENPCPNGYLQYLAEPGRHPHMSQIHNNHTGTKEITDSNHNEVF